MYHNRISTPAMKRAGYIRVQSEDFSDDGSRFIIFQKGDVKLSYHYSDDYGHFMSPRFDYIEGLSYRDYALFPSYKDHDKFNNTESDFDISELDEIVAAMQTDIDHWKQDPQFARKAEQKKIDDYKKMLEEEYMSETDDQKAKDAVWNQAWEYGHSSGLEEVRNFYIDLSSLAYKCMFR